VICGYGSGTRIGLAAYLPNTWPLRELLKNGSKAMPRYPIRAGAWEKVLADVECDTMIVDPPYSKRVHSGQSGLRRAIAYEPWTKRHIRTFVDSWHERTSSWMVAFTSHDLIGAWQRAYARVGWYAFAPVIVCQKVPRFSGDGPANWARYLISALDRTDADDWIDCVMAARPRTKEAMRWRALPGMYTAANERGAPIVGAKTVALLKELVRDYSNPGDLVADACSGYGSTRLAALELGRRFVGAEIDDELCRKANARQCT